MVIMACPTSKVLISLTVYNKNFDILWWTDIQLVVEKQLIHTKKCWVKYNPALGKIWTNQ